MMIKVLLDYLVKMPEETRKECRLKVEYAKWMLDKVANYDFKRGIIFSNRFMGIATEVKSAKAKIKSFDWYTC